jgi:hypothetical protein
MYFISLKYEALIRNIPIRVFFGEKKPKVKAD